MKQFFYIIIIFFVYGIVFSCGTTKKFINFSADTSLFAEHNTMAYDSKDFWYRMKGMEYQSFSLERGTTVKIKTSVPVYFNEQNAIGIGNYTAYPGGSIIVKQDYMGNLFYADANNAAESDELYFTKIFNSNTLKISDSVFQEYIKGDTLPITNTEGIKKDILNAMSDYSLKERRMLAFNLKVFPQSNEFINNKVYEIQGDSLIKIYWLYDKFLRPKMNNDLWKNICKEFCNDLDSITNNLSDLPDAFESATEILFDRIKEAESLSGKFTGLEHFEMQQLLIIKYFNGLLRDYLLSKNIAKHIDNNLPKKYLDEYFSVCKNNNYKKNIKTKLKHIQSLKNKLNDKILDFNTGNRITVQRLISSKKDSLILIDFWASWCVPCRQQLPYLKKLENLFKEKDIVFISISWDKDSVSWKDACRLENITNNSFRMPEFKRSKFIADYNIISIPRYMLFGKDGKIISSYAPHPDDRALHELIEKNL